MGEPRLVKCLWNDAWGNKEDEVHPEDVLSSHAPIQVETIGWLLADNEVGVSIFNERYEGKFRGRTFILRGMVIQIEDVLPPKKVRKKKNILDIHQDGNGEVHQTGNPELHK